MKKENPRPSDEAFTFYWDIMLPDLEKNASLNPGHLLQFKVLCDAYCQYDKLKEKVDEEGTVLVKINAQGESFVPNPNVTQLNKITDMILKYSKALGLLIAKSEIKSEATEEEDDWC
jgi:phage terminase small subunit